MTNNLESNMNATTPASIAAAFTEACINDNTPEQLLAALIEFKANPGAADADIENWMHRDNNGNEVSMSRQQWYDALTAAVLEMTTVEA